MASTPDITLITPTGGRPQSFARCVEYVQRQRFAGSLQWIIVDDGWPPITSPEHSERDTVSVIHLPLGKPGEVTLARNLLAAIPEVQGDKVLIIEDDDWYSDYYVVLMSQALDGAKAAGCWQSVYYHVPSRKYRKLAHAGRSSLCHTGFRSKLLPLLRTACETTRGPFVDVTFWEGVSAGDRCLRVDPLCIGIKGMPGRKGIGIGHRPEDCSDTWTADPDLIKLREWIGNDCALYA